MQLCPRLQARRGERPRASLRHSASGARNGLLEGISEEDLVDVLLLPPDARRSSGTVEAELSRPLARVDWLISPLRSSGAGGREEVGQSFYPSLMR